MIQAELRRLHSPDAPKLDDYTPSTPEHFGILVQAIIGPKAGLGEESFDFMVCTPSWLGEQVARAGYIVGRHHLVVDHYDMKAIRAVIQDLCRQAVGPNWASVAAYLARFGKWEFEDYQEGS